MVKETSKDGVSRHDRDSYLSWLVRITNNGVSGVKVMLNVGGITVIGTLISVEDFFAGVSNQMANTLVPVEHQEVIRQLFNPFLNQGVESSLRPTLDPTDEVYYIHLADVLIYQANTHYATDFWRGRLSAVDGFCLGALPQDEK